MLLQRWAGRGLPLVRGRKGRRRAAALFRLCASRWPVACDRVGHEYFGQENGRKAKRTVRGRAACLQHRGRSACQGQAVDLLKMAISAFSENCQRIKAEWFRKGGFEPYSCSRAGLLDLWRGQSA